MSTSSTITYMCMICEPGERLAESFERFYDELNQCDWYLLPTDIMRLYLMFLLDTQQPVYFECFGGILCTRETYKRVIKDEKQ